MQNTPKNVASALCFWLYRALAKTQTSAGRSRLTVCFQGHVQGVGFRYTTKKLAAGFEVTGTIRNLASGQVELIAEGTREELEAFHAAILNQGLAGFIRDQRLQWGSAQNEFRGFEIIK
jgi:acylphosphatase